MWAHRLVVFFTKYVGILVLNVVEFIRGAKVKLVVLFFMHHSRRRVREYGIALLILRALAHTPAFCRSRIRLRSWSFSHVQALPLPVVSLILNAAQERCLYIEIGSATCLCSNIFRTDWGI